MSIDLLEIPAVQTKPLKAESAVLHFPIQVVGLGLSERPQFSRMAKWALNQAELIIGSERQLQAIFNDISDAQEVCILPKFKLLKRTIQRNKNKRIAVLANGDPLYYGIGKWLIHEFGKDFVRIYPGISSIQMFCNRLGVAQESVEVVSLCGRPIRSLMPKLGPHKKIVVLTDHLSTPQNIARLLVEIGMVDVNISIGEQLGFTEEVISNHSAHQLSCLTRTFDSLNIVMLEIGRVNQGCLPGLGVSEEMFEVGTLQEAGLITQSETRIMLLSLLELQANDLIWDVGAGFGDISIEIALFNPAVKVLAIEKDQACLRYLQLNRDKFGVSTLVNPVWGQAPECFSDLPVANKMVISGGGDRLREILQQSWQALPFNGLLVGISKTLIAKEAYLDFVAELSDDSVQVIEMKISKGQKKDDEVKVGPMKSVTFFKLRKPHNNFVDLQAKHCR